MMAVMSPDPSTPPDVTDSTPGGPARPATTSKASVSDDENETQQSRIFLQKLLFVPRISEDLYLALTLLKWVQWFSHA